MLVRWTSLKKVEEQYGIILKNNKADDEKAIYMLKSIVLITAVLTAITHAQAGTLGVGYVLDCNPLEQQFIVDEQVNNQLPITNPQILRFAVLTDRSLQVKSLDKSKKNLSQNNAQYAGEEIFGSAEGEIEVSKWTKVDEFQAVHNLYFASTKNNKWLLEERISKDKFKRMFVINYSCDLVSAPLIKASNASMANNLGKAEVEKISANPQAQTEPRLDRETQTGAIKAAVNHGVQVKESANNKLSLATLTTNSTATSTTRVSNQTMDKWVEHGQPELYKCLGTSVLKRPKQADQTFQLSQGIPLSFDRVEGRFEISAGWDKTTENGITAWVDPKENSRNQNGEGGKKASIYATLESKSGDTTTTLILKMDTLKLYVKYEKISAGLTDTFQGICTPEQ